MRIRSLLFTAALATPLVVGSAASVSAQEYGGTGGTTEDRGDKSTEVLGESLVRPAPTEVRTAPTEVGGVGTTRQAPVSSNTLPVTGGDLAGLAILGVTLVGGGTVLVRRTRQQPVPA